MKRSLIALVVAVTAVLAIATPALAAQSGHLCMTYGSHYCADASTVADDFHIWGGNGRDLEWAGDGGTWNGYSTGTIKFTYFNGECVDAPHTNTYLWVGPCSGVSGVTWAKVDAGNGNYRFINLYQTRRTANGMYEFMTAMNSAGSYWFTDCRLTSGAPCRSGEYQTFDWR
jgi:hypothetical protein